MEIWLQITKHQEFQPGVQLISDSIKPNSYQGSLDDKAYQTHHRTILPRNLANNYKLVRLFKESYYCNEPLPRAV